MSQTQEETSPGRQEPQECTLPSTEWPAAPLGSQWDLHPPPAGPACSAQAAARGLRADPMPRTPWRHDQLEQIHGVTKSALQARRRWPLCVLPAPYNSGSRCPWQLSHIAFKAHEWGK